MREGGRKEEWKLRKKGEGRKDTNRKEKKMQHVEMHMVSIEKF